MTGGSATAGARGPGGETFGALVLFLAGVQSLDQPRKVFWTSLGGLRLVCV
jgi:hypothetical protein